ncbi:MAG: hypothetical protein QM817_22445 [Archangium sp.]
MNRLMVVALGAVTALSGCNFGVQRCDNGQTCPTGSSCDTASGFCFANDSGMGGGAGGGGGSGGGAATSCASGCADWQTCNPNAAVGGLCSDVVVRIVAPANEDMVFGGGSSVRVTATVTQWDGGALNTPDGGLPLMIAGAASGGSSLARTGMPGTYEGAFLLANESGNVTFTAGWSAANAARRVRVSACSASCADWEQCVPDLDGGSCEALSLSLHWDVPTAGSAYGPNATPSLSLSVTGDAFSKPIPFSINGVESSVALMKIGQVWVGSANLGPSDGPRTLVAGWDGGPTATVNVRVDAVPPQLGLVLIGDGGYFQRDDLIYAVLTSSEGLSDAGVQLGNASMARVPDSNCGNFATVPDASQCFLVDFSAPTFDALDGGLPLQVSGVDGVGNSTVGFAIGSARVTRVRWIVDPVNAGGEEVRAAPVVAGDGLLYIGSGAPTGTGTVVALDPSGAVAGTTTSTGAIVSLAIANSTTSASATAEPVIYFAANTTTNGQVGARRLNLLTSTAGVNGPALGSNTNTFTYAGLALYAIDSNEVGALAAVNARALPTAAASRLAIYGPSSNPTPLVSPGDGGVFDMAQVGIAPNPSTATNIVVDGSNAALVTRSGGLSCSVQVVAGINSTPSVGGRFDAATGSAFAYSTGVAWTGTEFLMSGYGTITSLYRVAPSGVLTQSGNLTVPADNGVAAILDGTSGVIGRGTDLVRFDPSNLTLGATRLVQSVSVRTSPVLGKARPNDTDRGYAATTSGEIVAFDPRGAVDSGKNWGSPFTSATVATHPTLDCNRRFGGATTTTGVLYVVALDGQVAAIVVDSVKLLDTATWPKYQRTAGNAGNTDNNRFPLNPGCPP